MNNEDLTIFLTASFRKYMDQAGVGVPIRWLQQGEDGESQVEDEVQILTSFEFPRYGSKNEDYAIMNVSVLVKSKIVPTDPYYHTRIKARVAGLLQKVINVYKIGGDDIRKYDKSQIGILRKIPSETLKITPDGINTPESSVVETFLEFQAC
jgi:hypothetical protein